MNYDFSELQIIFPEQLWLELSPEAKEFAWQQTASQLYSTPTARFRAFLNCLSLNTFLTWLKDDSQLSQTLKTPNWNEFPSIWEVVNGCAITLGDTKIVLIPSDKSNPLEFEVPYEWVVIPNWAATYYLAVQLNLEQSWLRVWGYTTHTSILDHAEYDQLDRTYCLDRECLIEDLNVMWVAREYSQQLSNVELKPLSNLSTARAEKLINYLSQSNINSPRLYGNFEEWVAFIASDELRHKLYTQRLKRLSNTETSSYATNAINNAINIGRWLENIFEAGWQHADVLLERRTLAPQFRTDTALAYRIKGAKLIDLGMQLGNQAVVLLVALSPEIDDKVSIRVQLYPANGECYLPTSIKLSLLSHSGTLLQEVVSRSHDNYIQLKRFKFSSLKFFTIQIMLDDVTFKEDFMLDALLGKSP